ncbi:hypothetical protein ANAEL_02131 [Anaerolineales bacterium]|nr:hypothetical protein ANAEL_02131 [Anaerolineales bacterium]
MFRLRSSKMFAIVLVIMAFATAAYAFAASNTVPASNAGEGSAAIGGYTVTNVTYTYSTANPSMLTFVDFDIAPAATKAGVSLVTGATLTDCGALTAGGTHAHCPVNVSVLSADMLRVVASD